MREFSAQNKEFVRKIKHIARMEPVEKESPEIFDKLTKLLAEKKVEFKVTEHVPVKTSEEAAKVRGVSVASGAKAMLLKFAKSKTESCVLVFC